MDFKNLITFIQVAQLNSFSKAAESLGYAQSSVSSQIRQLETELKTPLFDRINHTVSLTSRGQELLEIAYEIEGLVRKMKETGKADTEIRGHVRIAMGESLCITIFSERFTDFRRQYPHITLKIYETGSDEMLQRLNHNEVDFIMTLEGHIYNTEYVIAAEEKLQMHFIADPKSPFAQKKNLSFRDLLKEPFILPEKGMGYRHLMDQGLAAMSYQIQPLLEVGNTDLICHLVGQGNGLSFLPDYATKKWLDRGELVYLDVTDFSIDVWKQLLYHRDKWVSPEMKAVMDFLIS